jgi:hypothetical protein
LRWFGFEGEQAVDLGLGQDALGQRVLPCRQLEHRANVERQIPGALAEGEKRLDGGQAGRRPRARALYD